MMTLSIAVAPKESVTVTIYVPAHKPIAESIFCTGKVFQEYEYGATPPLAFAVAEPSHNPKHDALVEEVILTESWQKELK